MKLSIYTSLLSVAAIASSSAALYTSNFDSFSDFATEFAGQDGWTISDAGGGPGTLSSVADLGGSKALGLGGTFASTTTPSVSLSQSFVESVGRVSATFDFSFEDSSDDFPARDTFSFSFNGSSGKLFEVSFVPQAQSLTPSSTTAKWDAFYSVSGGAPVSLAIIDLEEAGDYSFELTLGGAFTPGNTTTSNYNLKIGSGPTVLERTGSIALNPQLATTGFSFNYTATDGIGLNGDNSILVDNLTVVPEPSSSLLLALTGLGLITRRRRA